MPRPATRARVAPNPPTLTQNQQKFTQPVTKLFLATSAERIGDLDENLGPYRATS